MDCYFEPLQSGSAAATCIMHVINTCLGGPTYDWLAFIAMRRAYRASGGGSFLQFAMRYAGSMTKTWPLSVPPVADASPACRALFAGTQERVWVAKRQPGAAWLVLDPLKGVSSSTRPWEGATWAEAVLPE
jgi:hypothetical protein